MFCPNIKTLTSFLIQSHKPSLSLSLSKTKTNMAIVAAVDDSFKRQGSIPFSWEIRPGVPKTQVTQPGTGTGTGTGTGNGNTPLLQPTKKLSPLRLKPRSHSQPLHPPALSPPSSSFISKSRPLSPLTPSFPTPSKLKPPPPSQSGLYSPAPSFRSTPRAFSERWQLNRVKPGSESEPRPSSKPRHDFAFAGLGCFPTPKFRLKKNKNGGLRKTSSDRDYSYDMETLSPWTVSSLKSVSPRWDSPKSSFSSLRFSPRLANEAEWVGLGLF